MSQTKQDPNWKNKPTTEVNYTKLKDGGWGLRGPKTMMKEGGEVAVVMKNGATKTEVVQKVIWWDDKVALATIKPKVNPHLETETKNVPEVFSDDDVSF